MQFITFVLTLYKLFGFCAFDKIHNPSNKNEDIGNWTLESTHDSTVIDGIAEDITLYPGAYYTYSPYYRWLDNSDEALILRDAVGEVIDRTPLVSDNESDNRYWL